MFGWIKKSVKRKILLAVLSIIIVAGGAMTYVAYIMTAGTLVAQKQDALKEATVSEALNLNQKLDQAQDMVRIISDDSEVQSFLKNQNPAGNVDEVLRTHLTGSLMTDIAVLRTDGVVEASTDKTLLGKSYAEEEFYKRAMDGENSVEHTYNIQDRKIQYQAFSPVRTNGSQIIGVVVAGIQPDALFGGLTSTTLHDVGDLVAVDNNGMVLYSTDPKDMFKSLWTLFDTEKEDIASRYKIASASIKSMQYEAAKDKVKNYAGPMIFDFNCVEDNNKSEMMGIAKVGSYPLYLATEFSKEKVTDVAMKNALTLAGIGILLVLITVFVTSYMISRLLRPIKILRNAIESIGRGNLDQDINIKTSDEFRELGDTIDGMAKRIKEKEIVNNAKNRKKSQER